MPNIQIETRSTKSQIRLSMIYIKLAQINLRKSPTATQTVMSELIKRKVDIVLVTEPAFKNNKIQGLPTGSTPLFHNSSKCRAAIIILNNKVNILNLPQFSDQDMVTCIITPNHPIQPIDSPLPSTQNTSSNTPTRQATRSSFIISSVYMAEMANKTTHKDIDTDLDKLQNLLNHFNGKDIFIGTDSNAHIANKGSQETNNRGYKLDNFITLNNLNIANNNYQTPTFFRQFKDSNNQLTTIQSYIDFTITNSKVTNWNITDKELFTDHRLITFEIETTNSQTEQQPQNTTTRLFNTQQADWNLFKEEINNRIAELAPLLENTTSKSRLLEILDFFTKELNIVIHNTIPNRNLKTQFAKIIWWDGECRAAKTKLNRSTRRLHNTKDLACREYWLIQSKQDKRDYKILINLKKLSAWRKFLNETDINNVYDLIKITRRDKRTPFSAVEDEDGDLISDLDELANYALNNLYGPPQTTNQYVEQPNSVCDNSSPISTTASTDHQESFDETTLDELKFIINRMKENKCPGYDGLDAKIIKHLFNSIPTFILKLYNKCLELRVFPDSWKLGVLILVPKPGKDTSNIINWRPITLLSLLAKVLDRLIANRLNTFLYKHNLMSNCQFGFIAQRSTINALDQLCHNIRSTHLLEKQGILISLDIKGAFDNVDINSIIRNLKNKSVPKYLQEIIADFLSNRSIQFTLNNKTHTREIRKGVPQGAILSPTLWNIVMDELLTDLEQSELGFQIAFADDLNLLLSDNDAMILEYKANTVIKKATDWGNRNGLKFNTTKTQIMKININNDYAFNIQMYDESLIFQSTVKCLGIIIDDRLRFKIFIDNLINSTKNGFAWFNMIVKNTFGLNPHLTRLVYKVYVEPKLTYACQIWYKYSNVKSQLLNSLTKLQRQFLIKITKSYRTTSYKKLYLLSNTRPIDLTINQLSRAFELKNSTTTTTPSGELIQIKRPINWYNKIKLNENNKINLIDDNLEYLNFISNKNNLLIYTKGTKSLTRVGCGVLMIKDNNQIYEKSYRIADCCTSFSAELNAIEEALFTLTTYQLNLIYENIVIICNSTSAIFSIIKHNNLDDQVFNILSSAKILTNNVNRKIYIKWVRQNQDNNFTKIQKLTNDCLIDDEVYNKMSTSTLLNLSNQANRTTWLNRIDLFNLDITKLYIPEKFSLNSNKFIDLVSYYTMPFLTGHGPIGEYLKRFHIIDSDICLNCNLQVQENVQHLLFDCSKFSNIRSRLLAQHNIINPTDLKKIYNNEQIICDFKRYCETVIKNKVKL